MERLKRTVWVLLFLTGATTTLEAQFRAFPIPVGPRMTQRGRIVSRVTRHGSYYREKWGNGLTPQGAAVLTTAIQTAGPILQTLVSPTSGLPQGGVEEDTEGREGESGEVDFTDLSAKFGEITAARNERRKLLTETNSRLEEIFKKLQPRYEHEVKAIAIDDDPLDVDTADGDGNSGDVQVEGGGSLGD